MSWLIPFTFKGGGGDTQDSSLPATEPADRNCTEIDTNLTVTSDKSSYPQAITTTWRTHELLYGRNDTSAIYFTILKWQTLRKHETFISLLKTKRNLLYIRNQSVPRSKHFPPRL